MQEPSIGWTALFFAIMNNNIKILDFLLVHGADVSITDKESYFLNQKVFFSIANEISYIVWENGT